MKITIPEQVLDLGDGDSARIRFTLVANDIPMPEETPVVTPDVPVAPVEEAPAPEVPVVDPAPVEAAPVADVPAEVAA